MRNNDSQLDGADRDRLKFTYHEGARIARELQDRICVLTFTQSAISDDVREWLCDSLIELHQLLYHVTLYELHDQDPNGVDDDCYADGRPVVSQILLPDHDSDRQIPIEAYRSDVGDEFPP
jgi:hypothetical protein